MITSVTVIPGWISTSAPIIQAEEENDIALSSSPLWNSDGEIDERKHHRGRFRRPHIERVWITRPVDNNTNSNIRPNDNFSDPIRSFAVAIRDPEAFLHYLRQEESERSGRQNWTKYNEKLPRSRIVQMQIMSQSDSKGKVPILHMVVEQDDKMDMNSFMDLLEHVSSLPTYNTRRSESNGEDASVSKLQKEQKKIWAHQRTQEEDMQQEYQQYGNSIHKEQLNEGNISHEVDREVPRKEPELELEKGRKEQTRRKTDRRQKEPYYRTKDRIAEPLLIIGKFGQRIPNYSRSSTREFNRSKSHDVLIAPSLHLLPPAVTTFRDFNLPQDVSSFAETPAPKFQDVSYLRRRNRPRIPNSRRPLDVSVPTTDMPGPLTHVHNKIKPLALDVPHVSTDIPRLSTNIPPQSTQISFSDVDISHVHIDIPRIYAGISRPHTDVSPPPSDTSHPLPRHISIFRQLPNPRISSSSSRSTNNPGRLEGFSSSNGSELSHEATAISQQPSETFESADRFRHFVDISPPSADIIPPLLPTFVENPTKNEYTRLSAESKGHEDIFIMNNATYNSYEHDESSGRAEQVANNYTTSNLRESPEETTRNIKDVFPSLTDILVQKETSGNRASTVTGDRKSTQQPLSNPVHREDEYDQVQLTAAETAYYRRRQLTRKSFRILETAGECV